MDRLPLLPHIAALVLVAALGFWNARRLRRARPELDAENGLRLLPHVWVLCGAGALVAAAVFWLITRPIGVQAGYRCGSWTLPPSSYGRRC